jgi:hypothetical protein
MEVNIGILYPLLYNSITGLTLLFIKIAFQVQACDSNNEKKKGHCFPQPK